MGCFVMLLFVQCVVLMLAPLGVLAEQTDENTVASLMALRVAVTHDPSSTLQNWSQTSRHFCNWTGVQCCVFSHRLVVVAMDLRNLNLGGFIPPQIANLSSLRLLDLSHNNFSGHIPPALGRLQKLKQLYLSKNNLTGSIPSEFGNLGRLEILSSYGNNHSGRIPEELGNCSMLRKIDLAQNRLT